MSDAYLHQARDLHRHMQRLRNYVLSGKSPLQAWSDTELTLPQAKALLVLHTVGPCTLKTFAARSGISGASASQMIDRLVDLGFVDRHQDPEDRRRVVLELTEEAKTRTCAHEDALLQRLAELMEMIGPEHTARWLGVAEEISRVLEQQYEHGGHAADRQTI